MRTIAILDLTIKKTALGFGVDPFEDFAGQPLFRWGVDKLNQVKAVDTILLLCLGNQRERLEAISLPSKVKIKVLEKEPCYPVSPAWVKKRKWGLTSWRGGVVEAYAFLEWIHPMLHAFLAQEEKADTLVSAEFFSPLLSASFLEDMLESFHKRTSPTGFLTSAAPVGLRWDIFSASALAFFARQNLDFYETVRLKDKDSLRDPIQTDIFFPLDLEIVSTSLRFTYDSRRQKEYLNFLYREYGSELFHLPLRQTVEKAKAKPFFGRLPRWVELQVSPQAFLRYPNFPSLMTFPASQPLVSDPPLSDSPYPPSTPFSQPLSSSFMDMKLFEKIVEELIQYDDVCMRLGGYAEPLLHPHIWPMIQRAKEKGIFGLHLQTDGLHIAPEEEERILEGNLDLLSILFTGFTRESYREIGGVDRFEEVKALTERLIERTQANPGKAPIILPEMVKLYERGKPKEGYDFFEYWFLKNGAVSIKNLKFSNTPFQKYPLLPPQRGLCRKLSDKLWINPDGTVPLCDVDYRKDFVLGSVRQQSLAELWASQSLQTIRRNHLERNFHEPILCESCVDWMVV